MSSIVEKNNIYHEILHWGEDHIENGVSFSDFKSFLADHLNDHFTEARAKSLFRELFTPLDGGNTPDHITKSMERESKFHLKVKAEFRRIQIVELKQATRSARSAMGVAIAAIVISLLVGFAQIAVVLVN
jgi:hypothetical protein